MRLILVTERTRPGSDEVSRRETVLQGEEIRMGRGSPMEISLPEIDVDYHHATVSTEGGQIKLSAVGVNGIMLGKKEVRDVVLASGTTARVDKYEFTAEPGRDGADHVLVMRVLAEAPGRRAKRKEKRALADVLPGQRPLAWLFLLAILGAFVLWPMSDVLTRTVPDQGEVVVTVLKKGETRDPHPMEALWSSGPLSKAHQGMGGDCSGCHLRAFEKTTPAACLSCHADLTRHADQAKHPGMALSGDNCSDCHKEHMGGEEPTLTDVQYCTSCHENQIATGPGTHLKPMSGYMADHPNFEPEIITAVSRGPDGKLKPELIPRPFPKDAVLQEKSGLRFPHDKHMARDGVALLTGRQPLGCADCHSTEADGNLMRPIKMERDCGGCHQLEFAPAGVAISLPHADEAGIAKIVRAYFEERVAEGTVVVKAEKTNRRRRLGGQDHNVGGLLANSAWAGEETDRQLDSIFGLRLCATCHEAQKVGDAETASGWLVQPALLQRHWMPRAEFSHERHKEMNCEGCHAASTSSSATDVLMPQVAVCRDCHRVQGQEDAVIAYLEDLTGQPLAHLTASNGSVPPELPPLKPGSKAVSAECSTCHQYHKSDETPVSPAHAELYKAALGEE
ncbi:MAG: cytochrome c3 family protein [Pseudomonadota bacterium]